MLIPATHWLESWGDVMPETGVYTLMQPTIQKVYKSRQVEESLLIWTNGKGATKIITTITLKANAVTILGGTSFNPGIIQWFQ